MRFRPALILIISILTVGCRQQVDVDLPPAPVELATATPGGRTTVWIATPTVPPVVEVAEASQPEAPAADPAQPPQAPATIGSLSCISSGEPSLPASAPPITGFVDVFLGYLAEGGPLAVMQTTLEEWRAIDADYGLVSADRDLTGNNEFDVLILVQAPDAETDQPLPPGDLLIFGCEAGELKLLHQAGFNPDISLPQIAAVQDLTGDLLDDIIYARQTCDGDFCTESLVGITFDPTSGAFDSLFSSTIQAPNAEISVTDTNEDGIPDISIRENTIAIDGAGPLRERTLVYSYDGENLSLSETIPPTRPYRIHVIQDADDDSTDANFVEAIPGYEQAADITSPLRSWTLRDEDDLLRAYALYRLTVAQAASGQFEAAQASFDELSSAYGEEGLPGNLYFQLGRAFWESYQPEQVVGEGCAAAQAFAINTPDVLTPLNSFGTSNPSYQVEEICPL